jgi:SAM-dependent methyltransferase
MHRYPTIFKDAKRLLSSGPKRLLSFGCSSGQEVRSLRELSEDWRVDGIDVKEYLIRQAREEDPGGTYALSCSELEAASYDAIFCLSVLCRWPDRYDSFSFADFEAALQQIDALLKPGGVLVLYNAQYDLAETKMGEESYVALRDGVQQKCSGYIPKLCSSGQVMQAERGRSVALFYRKLS